MSPELRVNVFSIISEFYEEAQQASEEPWTAMNVKKLIPYVPFNQISKIRGCFLFARKEPSVFLEPAPQIEIPDEDRRGQSLDAFEGFTWRPRAQLAQYKSKKENPGEDNTFRGEALQYFTHITNHVARVHKCKEGSCSACCKCGIQPSPYLDLSISMDQHRLFNPKKEDMFMGSIMEAASGKKAVKKIAKRRLDMSRGNVASYSAMLNGPHQLAQFQEANDLTATLGELHSEKEREKEAAAILKRTERAKKVGKRADQEKDDKAKKESLMPGLERDVGKGVGHVVTLRNGRLKEILRYYFNHPTKGLTTMKKDLMQDAIRKHMEEGSNEEQHQTVDCEEEEQNQVVDSEED
jgi:hypothetical protein